MLGISWFWFYGAMFLAQFAGFTQGLCSAATSSVVDAAARVFSVGIGIGSLLCERLSGRKVEIGLVPFGSIGLTLFAVDLWLASRHLQATRLAGLGVVPREPGALARACDLVLIGVFGGFYIVPLYALIQERSEPAHRSRIIAANNILNAVFMVASAGARASACCARGLSIPQLFLVTALMNAAVAIYIYGLVPEFLMRFLAWLLIHTIYRVASAASSTFRTKGRCIVVVQPRELRRCAGDRRLRAPADPLRDGSPHLPGCRCCRSSSARCGRFRSPRRRRMPR